MILVRASLFVLGIAAVSIGLMVFLMGPHWTANTFATLAATVGATDAYSGNLTHANIDSEMRFYAVFWAAFGAWVLRAASRKILSPSSVVIALGLFWVGGLGRVLSYLQLGHWPDGLFVGLTIIEVSLPPLFVALYYLTKRN